MAKDDKLTLWGRLSRIYDRASNAWLAFGSLIPAGAMSYLASITDWIAPYGPLAWGLVGLSTFSVVAIVVSVSLSLVGHFREKSARARMADGHRLANSINPLEKNFTSQRIKVSDLYHPFFQPIQGATFRDCEFFGPGAVWIAGGHIMNSTFAHCDIIVVKDDAPVTGAVALKDCSINGVTFWQVPIYMTYLQYRDMYRSAPTMRLDAITYLPAPVKGPTPSSPPRPGTTEKSQM